MRTEEEIREEHKRLLDIGQHGRDDHIDSAARWLEWVLEDSEPTHEHFPCPQCHEVWHNEYNMLHRCCVLAEPKPIEKLKPYKRLANLDSWMGDSGPSAEDIAFIYLFIDKHTDTINEIIDRLNDMTKAQGER